MSRYAKVLSFAILMASSIACSKGGLLTLERTPASHILQSATGAEFVSSSGQYETTLLNSYKVQQSAGDFIPNVQQTSTNGYKLYSTVQGVMLCEPTNGSCTTNSQCCSNHCNTALTVCVYP